MPSNHPTYDPMTTYPNPLYTGTPSGALFSHYELSKVFVDPSGSCEPVEDDDPCTDAANVMWSVYGRYGQVNDHRGAECIGDFDTREAALSILRAMGIRTDETDAQAPTDDRLQALVTAATNIERDIRTGQAMRYIGRDARLALASALEPFQS